MVDGPAIETYEQQPRPWPEGAVPVDGQRSYTLTEADTALSNPLEPTTANIQQGRQAWTNYCLPCHGESGAGDGPVINNSGDYPRRLPFIPTANLLADRTRGYTDGYIYGIITNGRGFMPSYRRIPRETRWQLVTYVRHLQRTASRQGGSSQSTENDGE
jgi:mono/diheme cytochrome c family protein